MPDDAIALVRELVADPPLVHDEGWDPANDRCAFCDVKVSWDARGARVFRHPPHCLVARAQQLLERAPAADLRGLAARESSTPDAEIPTRPR